jgi:hypothetical protein
MKGQVMRGRHTITLDEAYVITLFLQRDCPRLRTHKQPCLDRPAGSFGFGGLSSIGVRGAIAPRIDSLGGLLGGCARHWMRSVNDYRIK